jgi:hypothetical protein
MAVTRAARNTEVARIKRLSSHIHVRKVDVLKSDGSPLYDLWIKDDRLPPDNEAMSTVSADALVARATVRPGEWVRYEVGAGGAGTYPVSTTYFTETTGGGCTGF